jgi:hypothetical protein
MSDVIVTEKKYAKKVKVALENDCLLNKSFRLSTLDQHSFSGFVPISVGIQETKLWEFPSQYIAIPVHPNCIQSLRNFQESGILVTSLGSIFPFILGSANQMCPYSSSALGNIKGQVLTASALRGNDRSIECNIGDNVVKTVLYQALLQCGDFVRTTDKEKICKLIQGLPDRTIPQRLELMGDVGDDRTLVIPNRALNMATDEVFQGFMEKIFRGQKQPENNTDDCMTTFWRTLAEMYHARRVVRRGEICPDSKVRQSGHSILWMDPEFERTLISQHGEYYSILERCMCMYLKQR